MYELNSKVSLLKTKMKVYDRTKNQFKIIKKNKQFQ